MSKSLEDTLRAAVASRRLKGVTLWPSDKGWQGNARWSDSTGWTVVIDPDPVKALIGALTEYPNYDPHAVVAKPRPAPKPAVQDDIDDLV